MCGLHYALFFLFLYSKVLISKKFAIVRDLKKQRKINIDTCMKKILVVDDENDFSIIKFNIWPKYDCLRWERNFSFQAEEQIFDGPHAS